MIAVSLVIGAYPLSAGPSPLAARHTGLELILTADN